MCRINKLDLSAGSIVYCRRTGKRSEVVKHFAYSGIDHVVVAFDVTEGAPRQVTLSVSAARERFVSCRSASIRNVNFLPKLLAG